MTLTDSSLPQTKMSAPESLAARLWDIVVVGAGPAGALAAYLLAKQNLSVLLLDQATFPRRKVCGGCLSHRTMELLEQCGLSGLTMQLRAKSLHRLVVAAGTGLAAIEIPQGRSVSREQFDFALIEAAQEKGAVFLSRTKAAVQKSVDHFARVQVRVENKICEVRAKMILVSDGLAGDALRQQPDYHSKAAADSLIGLYASLDPNSFPADAGTIYMACGRPGYAGIVRREDERLEVAAAVHPAFLKSSTPAVCVHAVFEEAGLAIPQGLSEAVWMGTSPLPRTRRLLAGQRFFVLGDASGFVEPFTGEGIFWALLQARELVALLQSHQFNWETDLGEKWQRKHAHLLGKRKKLCRLIGATLRWRMLRCFMVEAIRRAPWLIRPLIRWIHGT